MKKPGRISQGDFILIAKPEGSVVEEVRLLVNGEGIGIGQIGWFMGALHRENVCEYEPSEGGRRRAG